MTWRRRRVLGLLPVVGMIGCSFLLNLTDSQCDATHPCDAKGATFAGYQCNLSNGQCCAPNDMKCLCVNRGPDCYGTDSSSLPDTSVVADVQVEAGPDCTTNAEASSKVGDAPALCVDGKVVPLVVPGVCPYVPSWNIQEANDVIPVGVFSLQSFYTPGSGLPVPVADENQIQYQALKFTFGNHINKLGAVPTGGAIPKFKKLLPIYCRSETQELIDQGAAHLFDKVKVPVAITAIIGDFFVPMWQKYVAPKGVAAPVIVVPAFYDDTYGPATGNDNVWFLTGGTLDSVPLYPPLFDRTVARLTTKGTITPSSVKVAITASSATVDINLSNAVADAIQVNGKPASDPLNPNVKTFSSGATQADWDTASVGVRAFAPDIILSFDSSRQFIESVEREWPNNQPPTWILTNHFLFNPDPFFESVVGGVGVADGGSPTARAERFLEVYNESDDAPPEAIEARFRFYNQISTPTMTVMSYENFFDAPYFVYYGLVNANLNEDDGPAQISQKLRNPGLLGLQTKVAASERDLTDDSLKIVFEDRFISRNTAMLRNLVDHTDTKHYMIGAEGAMFFNALGARKGSAAVACFKLNGEPVTPATISKCADAGLGACPCPFKACIDYDQLRLGPDGGSLVGNFTCNSYFDPPL